MNAAPGVPRKKGSPMRKFAIRMVLGSALVFGRVFAWSADWLTDGYDSKRTAWQRDEHVLSTSNVKDMKLLWKVKLDNEPRQMHALLPVLIVGRLNTASGPREVVIETGVSDNLFAMDAETGQILWKKHFTSPTLATGG